MMFNTNPEEHEELEVLIREAGAKLMALWPKKNPAPLNMRTKPDGSMVTEADLLANETLIQGLKSLFPGDAILSEEDENIPDLAAANRIWIMDPLDGTQSFIDGDDDFSILVALCENNVLTYGAMYFPARDLFAAARKGEGAFVNRSKVSVGSNPHLRDRSVYVRNYEPKPSRHLYDQWMDSGLAFLCVANGTLDGVILKTGRHKEWDIAAPLVMVEEAGGRVTDERGRPLSFKHGRTSYKYLVASNGRTHSAVSTLF